MIKTVIFKVKYTFYAFIYILFILYYIKFINNNQIKAFLNLLWHFLH